MSALSATKQTASLWRARSGFEKILIIAQGVSLIVIIFMCSVWIASAASHRHEMAGTTRILHVEPQLGEFPEYIDGVAGPTMPCLTAQCIHTASDILRSIDTSVRPCDDFYAFACNSWIKENPIPDGKAMWGTFGKLEQRNQLVIKNVLERPVSSFKSKAEKKAKLYYESCIDVNETMEKLGAEPLQTVLRQVGGWNVSASGFDVKSWSLLAAMKSLQIRYNVGGFFGWSVGEDDRNSSRYIIQIDQGGLSLPTREHYLNRTAHAKVLAAYTEYMEKVAVLLGGDISLVRPQVQRLLAFETRLAEITSELIQLELAQCHTISKSHYKTAFIEQRRKKNAVTRSSSII